jgi:DNA cross-link repair 1A protein
MSTHVHCGDMRFEPSLVTAAFPYGLAGLPRISRLFLDTTYADPAYDFPTQAAILSAVDGIVRREEALGKATGETTVYLCGAYTIGKEKVWMRVWKSLGGKGEVYAESRRKRTLECLDLGRVFAALGSEHCSPRMAGGTAPTAGGLRRTSSAVRVVSTESSASARVRVVTMSALHSESRLKETLVELRASCGFARLVAFRPTGWSFKAERGPGAGQRLLAAPDESQALVEGVGGTVKSLEGGRVKLFSVPYSEHSSVAELRQMVAALRPAEVIPTVAKSNQHRTQILDLLHAK